MKRFVATGITCVVALVLSGCGGKKEEVQVAEKETSADEILRLGRRWSNTSSESNLLSEPSPVAILRQRVTTELILGETSGTEHFVLEENVGLRKGGELRCSTAFEAQLKLRYGRREGEPVVEASRGPVRISRSCSGAHPEPTLEFPASSIILLLDADSLRVIEPKVDRRSFIPIVE